MRSCDVPSLLCLSTHEAEGSDCCDGAVFQSDTNFIRTVGHEFRKDCTTVCGLNYGVAQGHVGCCKDRGGKWAGRARFAPLLFKPTLFQGERGFGVNEWLCLAGIVE